jgi:hypothetical protein
MSQAIRHLEIPDSRRVNRDKWLEIEALLWI